MQKWVRKEILLIGLLALEVGGAFATTVTVVNNTNQTAYVIWGNGSSAGSVQTILPNTHRNVNLSMSASFGRPYAIFANSTQNPPTAWVGVLNSQNHITVMNDPNAGNQQAATVTLTNYVETSNSFRGSCQGTTCRYS